jgi:hypothetical protein
MSWNFYEAEFTCNECNETFSLELVDAIVEVWGVLIKYVRAMQLGMKQTEVKPQKDSGPEVTNGK